MPVPYVNGFTGLSLAVSASDGATAYMCNAVSAPGAIGMEQAQIWVTHDLGAERSQVGDLPALGSVDECSLHIDTTDGNRIVAQVNWQDVKTNAVYTDFFVSDTGGATWAMIAVCQFSSLDIEHIATAQGKTYALYSATSPWPADVPTPTAPPMSVTPIEGETHLAVSSDGLHTWRPIDEPILAVVGPNQSVKQFWAQVGGDGQGRGTRQPKPGDRVQYGWRPDLD